MNGQQVATRWADALGLADAPLFAKADGEDETRHRVLLNGGAGSFALSCLEDEELDRVTAESWAWSADLTHHVSVTPQSVVLSRWDDPSSRNRFRRRSVERQLEAFYKYLSLDEVSSSYSIVAHSINTFRRIRSYAAEKKLKDESAIHIFLFMLAAMISRRDADAFDDVSLLIGEFGLDSEYAEVLYDFDKDAFASIIEHFGQPRHVGNDISTWPQLLVRHAGGLVFQEAHFDLVSWSSSDLLGLPGPAQVKVLSRGGTHFTPPGLARTLVEQALRQRQPRDRMTIFDPACGSGVFLQEALRTLRRMGFHGDIHLIGRDSSPYATAMARFVVQRALSDWPAKTQSRTADIRTADSLIEEDDWPRADVIVMNPPFLSWRNLQIEERARLRSLLGSLYSGRADISMAFIKRALESVCEGGVVGTFMPASLLTLDSGLRWREHLLATADMTFLALLGDHSLFRHAIVEVAAAVFTKGKAADSSYLTIWTGEKTGAASEALRSVRKLAEHPMRASAAGEAWRVAWEAKSRLKEAPTWRPRPNRLQKVLERLTETCATTVKDMYNVRQGVIPGLREAYVISKAQYEALPRAERPYFRPIAENASILNGQIVADRYLFYPNKKDGTRVRTEEELFEVVPRFLEQHFLKFKNQLSGRARIDPSQWWRLSEARLWAAAKRSKIVSAYFGRAGSFAWDERGEFVVVQGYGWLSTERLRGGIETMPHSDGQAAGRLVQLAYIALCNSPFFDHLLAEFCPHVAGGQFNLSKRYIDRVPLPELPGLALQSAEMSERVYQLSRVGRAMHSGEPGDRDSSLNALVAELYRIPITSWPAEAA